MRQIINKPLLKLQKCVTDWVPGEWGACVDGVQTRTCVDANGCDTTEVCPTEQSCTVETPAATTETPAPVTTTEETTTQKGFLSIVGSAIATPFNYMFGNKTRIIIFSAVLLLVIGGILAFKFSPVVKLRVLKLLNIRKKREV
jgi:hypothetical protein